MIIVHALISQEIKDAFKKLQNQTGNDPIKITDKELQGSGTVIYRLHSGNTTEPQCGISDIQPQGKWKIVITTDNPETR